MPLFLVALIPAAFFVDGGFANLAPYTPEIFPTSLRTHGMGLAWAVSGLGRIIGPLVIALVAGTGDLVDPEATLDALAPSFLFLAVLAAGRHRVPARATRTARPRPRDARPRSWPRRPGARRRPRWSRRETWTRLGTEPSDWHFATAG